MFYAHSENKSGDRHLLSEHLEKTAERASSSGNSNSAKLLFMLAGLLHDFGKYQQEFQKYLTNGGKRGSVPHSSFGAGYAAYPP